MSKIIKEGVCGDNAIWTLDDEDTLTISGRGEMQNYFCINYDPTLVWGLHAPWFTGVKTAIIEDDGITTIGNYAFYHCTSLTSVKTAIIEDGITTIGNYAFYHCTSLTSVTIPDSVTSIGNGAFSECTGLTSITIPDSVVYIGSHAFAHCKSLMITIPDSVTSIGDFAFEGCAIVIKYHGASSVRGD